MNKKKVKSPVSHRTARVPVILQMEALECGAASLAMVMAYYDRWIPLEQVRYDCGVSRDGSNARNIMLTGKHYGMEVKGFRCEPDALKEQGTFPCIIHWNFNHFVVLDGFGRNYAMLNDPARGRVKVSMEEFDNSFTGVVLMFTPGENFEPGGKRESVLSFVRKRMKGTRTAIIFTVIMTLLGYLFGLIDPGIRRFFMDRLLSGENRELLMPFLCIVAGLGILQIIVAWIQGIYNLKLSGKMAAVGNATYMWKVLKLPIVFFSQRMSGDIQGRQASNASIAETLVNTLAPLALSAVMMVFYLVIMIRYSLLLTLIGVISLMLNLAVTMIISNKRMEVMRVTLRDNGKLMATTIAGINQIETLKASGAENGFFQKWSGYQASVNAQQVRVQKMEQYLGAIPGLVSALADSAIVVMGVWLAMQGRFTLGMITAFQLYLSNLMSPAEELINAGSSIQTMRAEMERVEDVMNYPDDVRFAPEPAEGTEDYAKLKGHVEMKNVTFGYSRLAKPLIEDFNMGSQLIVHESQEAVFFMNGQPLDLFGAGRYTLETANIPLSLPVLWLWWTRKSFSLRIRLRTISGCGISPSRTLKSFWRHGMPSCTTTSCSATGDTMPCCPRTGGTCPAGSGSGWKLPACWHRIPPSSSWMRRPARWMPRPSTIWLRLCGSGGSPAS